GRCGRVEQRPVAHAGLGAEHIPIARAPDTAIVEGEHAKAALGEVSRVLRVVRLGHAAGRHDDDGTLTLAEDRGADAMAIGSAQPYLHEFQSSDMPPIRVSASRNITCTCACMRFTSHAAIALPGIVATPITTPVTMVCSSRRAKRWKSAALHRSSTMLTSASVAST